MTGTAGLLPDAMAALVPHLTVLLIIFARIGAVTMLLPAFSDDAIPGRIRLLFGVGLAVGLYGTLAPSVRPLAGSVGVPVAIVVAEIMVGLAMGMIVRLMFQAAAMAGAIASMQIGLSSALVFDPAQAGQASIMSRFAATAAAVVCLALDIHHLWISAILASYRAFPIGGLPDGAGFAALALMAAGQATMLALSLAAPMILYGILFNVALGLGARMAPALQVFFIAQPLNILLGLTLFATSVGTMLTVFADAMAGFLRQIGWH